MAPSKRGKKSGGNEAAQLRAEIARLKPFLGNLNTEEQLKMASHLQMTTGYGEWRHVKHRALGQFINTGNVKWPDIGIYRTMHQFPSYFVDGQLIDVDRRNELAIIVQMWVLLDCERRLGRLLMPDPVYAAKLRLDGRAGSAAELLREYIRFYKWKNFVESWDCHSMFDLG